MTETPEKPETAEHYLRTHGDILLKVLENCEKRARPATEDSDDGAYWRHEQRALQTVLARLNHPEQANASPESGEMVLVPREPTEAMIDAGQQMLPDDMPMADAIYKMMCAAGPKMDRDELAFQCFAAMVQAEDGQDLRAEWAACGDMDKAPYLRIVDALAVTPTPVADASDSRPDFEREAARIGLSLQRHVKDAGPFRAGDYADNRTKSAWHFWQVARSTTPKPAPGDAARKVDILWRYSLDRYVNGIQMAEGADGILARNFEEATAKALALFAADAKPGEIEQTTFRVAEIAQHTAPVLTEEERRQIAHAKAGEFDYDPGNMQDAIDNLLAIIDRRITGAQHGRT